MPEDKILIEISETGARVVKKNIEDIGKSAGESAPLVEALKKALEFVGIGFAIGEIVRELSAFEQAVKNVSVITGDTKEGFEEVASAAEEMSKVTTFSAIDAAGALGTFARSGFQVRDSVVALKPVLDLARTSMTDTGTAARQVSGALKGFNIDVSDSAHAADVLAKASTRTPIEGLGEAIKRVGPAAKATGVSLEDVTAILQDLSDAQIVGRFAGISLRDALQDLENPTGKVAVVLRALVGDLDSVKPSVVGVIPALETLAKSGVTGEIALQNFGRSGLALKAILDEGIPRLKNLREGLNDVSGFAEKSATSLDSTLRGAFDKVKNAFNSMIQEFGKAGATDVLKGSLSGLKDILETLPTAFQVVLDRLRPVVTAISDLIKNAIGHDIEVSFEGTVRLIATGIDTIVGGIKGVLTATGQVFIDIFKVAQSTCVEAANLIIRLLNDLLSVVRLRINDLIEFINVNAARVGVNIDIHPVAVGSITEFKNIYATGFSDIGKNASEAFKQSFEQTSATGDFVDEIFSKKRAAQAAAAAVANSAKTEVSAPTASGAPSDAGAAKLSEAEAQRKLILGELNQQLTKSIELTAAFAGVEGGTGPVLDAVNKLLATDKNLTIDEAFALAQQGIELNKILELEKRRGQILESIHGPARQAAQDVTILKNALAAGEITAGEYTHAMAGLQEQLVKDDDVLGGVTSQFKKFDDSGKQLGITIGQTLTGAIDQASGALADFALSGFRNVDDLKKAFSDLFAGIARDLLALIIKLLIFKAIKTALEFAAGGGEVPAAASGGEIKAYASGGFVGRQGEPILVGERGPELFVPPSAGQIVPNNRVAGSPNIQVPAAKVIVVNNEEQARAYINSQEGEKAVIQHIGKNRNQIKQLLGGA
jgi:TP901 family phage tail tape measure protein